MNNQNTLHKEALRFREENVEDVKKRFISEAAFYNLKLGNVVVPTAVKSHIANGMLLCACLPCVALAFALFCLMYRNTNTEFGMGSWLLLNPRQQKTRHIAVTGFSYLKPGNVLLSHSKCYTIIGAVSFHY